MKSFRRIKKLSEVVKELAEEGENKKIVADIACDHGYLAELISRDENVSQVIASDISEKCLAKVENLKKDYHLNKIETVLGDGLNPIERADISVIAGLGGYEIIKILKNQNKNSFTENKCKLFVLQPSDSEVQLRDFLFENELKIIKDFIVESGKRFYPIIVVDVSKTEKTEPSLFNRFIGRDNTTKSLDFRNYLKNQYELTSYLNNVTEAQCEKDAKLKEKYNIRIMIENLLKEC